MKFTVGIRSRTPILGAEWREKGWGAPNGPTTREIFWTLFSVVWSVVLDSCIYKPPKTTKLAEANTQNFTPYLKFEQLMVESKIPHTFDQIF